MAVFGILVDAVVCLELSFELEFSPLFRLWVGCCSGRLEEEELAVVVGMMGKRGGCW